MKEYGGCLPAEACLTRDANQRISPCALPLNSGRSAIYAAVLHSGCKSLYLPYYTCPTIKPFLEERGVQVKEYSLRPDWLPEVPALQKGECLLWTNYFGCMREGILQKVCESYGERLIVDNCQALFAKPVAGVYNVYSVRKFVGIVCGGFLYHTAGFADNSCGWNKGEAGSYQGQFLAIAAQYGSNAAYPLYLENERRIAREYGRMPRSVQRTVEHIDFQAVWKRRRANFLALHEALGPFQRVQGLDLEAETGAFYYPFYSENTSLRDYLVSKNVFCPTWWRRVLQIPESNAFEKSLAQHIVPLPIDQRYDPGDILEIASLIKTWQ